MYLVQSVLFDKSKFSLHLSKEWLKHHHYSVTKVDDKPKTYRFRQVSPQQAKKQGYTNFKTKKLGKSGVSLVLAYNECLCGGGLMNDELHHFLFTSYSSGKDYKTWKLDHSLSDKLVQVYFNPNTGKAVVVHRGSQDLTDWYENAKLALGFKGGPRLEHSRKIQKEAERKYGAKNVITIGHSRGAMTAEEVGKNSSEIITLNKPVTTWDILYGKKVPEHQTDIKTTFDPVSFLRPAQKGKEAENIHSISYNPLTEHLPDVLKRVGDEKYWGKGRCWKGYEPVPGKKPYSKGSCRKTGKGLSGGVIHWDIQEEHEFIKIFKELIKYKRYIINLTQEKKWSNMTEKERKKFPDVLNDMFPDDLVENYRPEEVIERLEKLLEILKRTGGFPDTPNKKKLKKDFIDLLLFLINMEFVNNNVAEFAEIINAEFGSPDDYDYDIDEWEGKGMAYTGAGSGSSVENISNEKKQEKFDIIIKILNDIYEGDFKYNDILSNYIIENVKEALIYVKFIPTDENLRSLLTIIKELLNAYPGPLNKNYINTLTNAYNYIVSNYPEFFKLEKPINDLGEKWKDKIHVKPVEGELLEKEPIVRDNIGRIDFTTFRLESEYTDYLMDILVNLNSIITHFITLSPNRDNLQEAQEYYNAIDDINTRLNRLNELFIYLQIQPLAFQQRMARRYIDFYKECIEPRQRNLEYRLFKKAMDLKIFLQNNVIDVTDLELANRRKERDEMERQDRPSGGFISKKGCELGLSCV